MFRKKVSIRTSAAIAVLATSSVATNVNAMAQQVQDPTYVPRLINGPMGSGQIIAVDSHHGNTSAKGDPVDGFYKVMTGDGYSVVDFGLPFPTNASSVPGEKNYVNKADPNSFHYDPDYLDSCSTPQHLLVGDCDYYNRLKEVDVLVIENAGGSPAQFPGPYPVGQAEAEVLKYWVENDGGNLFFVADHAPFTYNIEGFASVFGIEWPQTVFDPEDLEFSSNFYVPALGYSLTGIDAPGSVFGIKPGTVCPPPTSFSERKRYGRESTCFGIPVSQPLPYPFNAGTIYSQPITSIDPLSEAEYYPVAANEFGARFGLPNALPVGRVETNGGAVLKAIEGGHLDTQYTVEPLFMINQDYPTPKDENGNLITHPNQPIYPADYGLSTGIMADSNSCVNGKRGRIYLGGEAAMFSAKRYKFSFLFFVYYHQYYGMNVPTNDNENLLRNIMAWLTDDSSCS